LEDTVTRAATTTYVVIALAVSLAACGSHEQSTTVIPVHEMAYWEAHRDELKTNVALCDKEHLEDDRSALRANSTACTTVIAAYLFMQQDPPH
jgi:hypothetical protein